MTLDTFCRWVVSMFALLLLTAAVETSQAQPPAGAKPVAEKSAQDKSTEQKFVEFVGLLQQTTKLRTAEKFSDAAISGRQALAVLREIVPVDDENLETVLNLLAEINEQAEAWPDAAAFRKEAFDWSWRQRGKDHWRTVDARVAAGAKPEAVASFRRPTHPMEGSCAAHRGSRAVV